MSDPFHTEYRKLSDAEKQLILDIKETAAELYGLFVSAMMPPDQGGSGSNIRELALAKTKLEEAVMWAVKGVTK